MTINKSLIKIIFCVVCIGMLVLFGIYVFLNSHPNDMVDCINSVCQIAFLLSLIAGICISMSKLRKKIKEDIWSSLAIGMGLVLLLRFLGLGLLGRLF